MQNYKQKMVAGEIVSHTRACEIHIKNPYMGAPEFNYIEQEFIEYPDGSSQQKPCGNISGTLTNPAETFPKFDLDTMQVIGVYTYADLQQIIACHYLHLAFERDQAALAAQAAVAP